MHLLSFNLRCPQMSSYTVVSHVSRSALLMLPTCLMLRTHTHLSESYLAFALATALSFIANVAMLLNI